MHRRKPTRASPKQREYRARSWIDLLPQSHAVRAFRIAASNGGVARRLMFGSDRLDVARLEAAAAPRHGGLNSRCFGISTYSDEGLMRLISGIAYSRNVLYVFYTSPVAGSTYGHKWSCARSLKASRVRVLLSRQR